MIIQASPAGLVLPSPEYYEDEEIVQKYQDTLEAVFSKLLPKEGGWKRADKLAKSVVDLEKKIAAVTPPPEDQQDVTVSFIVYSIYLWLTDGNTFRNTTTSRRSRMSLRLGRPCDTTPWSRVLVRDDCLIHYVPVTDISIQRHQTTLWIQCYLLSPAS